MVLSFDDLLVFVAGTAVFLALVHLLVAAQV